MSEKLKIRAEGVEDLKILSALCQDAIIRVADMTYDAAARRFVLMLSRYRWEAPKRGLFRRRPAERVRAALRFDFVDQVQAHGIDRENEDGVLNLLSITEEEGQAPTHVLLSFSGGGSLRLTAEVIDATLDDLTTPWSAKAKPKHPDV